MPLTLNNLGTTLNRVVTKKAIAIARQRSRFMYYLTGDPMEGDQGPKGPPKFPKIKSEIDGQKFQVNLLGPITPYPRSSNRASRLAARTPAQSDILGKAEFELTHFPMSEDIDVLEAEKMVEQLNRGEHGIANNTARMICLKREKTLAQALFSNATNGVNDLNSGGVPYAIDAVNAFGGITRSDGSAVNYRGQVLDVTAAPNNGALSLRVIRELRNQTVQAGGRPDYLTMGLAVYNILETLVETVAAGSGGHVVVKDNTVNTSAPYFMYKGMWCEQEPFMPAQMLLGLSLDDKEGSMEEWDIRAKFPTGENFTWQRNPGTVASMLYQSDIFFHAIPLAPSHHFKITGIVSGA